MKNPDYLERDKILRMPTPASSAVWSIKIKFDPCYIQNRYSLYLDEYPYGGFSTSMHKSGVFSFECVPEGRVLAIAAGTDKTIDAQELPVAQPSDAIEQVIAVSNNHDCVVLHESR